MRLPMFIAAAIATIAAAALGTALASLPAQAARCTPGIAPHSGERVRARGPCTHAMPARPLAVGFAQLTPCVTTWPVATTGAA